MNKLFLATIIVFLMTPALVQAQSPGGHSGQGYVFVAPGGSSGSGFTNATLHAGAGGEALVYKGVGLGAEVGAIWPVESIGDALGLFSANGSYNFFGSDSDRKAVPFVTGGYTLLFREGTANLWNAGGGVNYWFRDNLGLRLEVRDHIWPRRFGSTTHLWQVRVALAFR